MTKLTTKEVCGMKLGKRLVAASLSVTLFIHAPLVAFASPAAPPSRRPPPRIPVPVAVAPIVAEDSPLPIEFDASSVRMAWSEGESLTVNIPGSDITSKPTPSARGVGYRTRNRPYNIDVVPSATGVQFLINIERFDAPVSYPFRFELPAGVRLRASPTVEGGIDLVQGAKTVVGSVAAPWAKDANGLDVPTRFVINGSTIVQEVDHAGFSYPVVADPDVTRDCGILSCTWYWSVAATVRLAEQMLTPRGDLIYGLTAAGVCAILTTTGAGGVVCGAIYAVGMYYFADQLNKARNGGRCFRISAGARDPLGSVSAAHRFCHAK